MSRSRAFALAAALAVLAGPGLAASQIQQLVARELPSYGFDVGVEDLTSTQLHAIYGILHGRHSHGEKRALIRSVLGGQFSLRGLLFN